MSKEEKEVLYRCYLESGLSPKDFAVANNISPAVIRGLISFHKRIDRGEKSSFIQITTKGIVNSSKTISFKLDNHLIEIDQNNLAIFLGAIS